MQPFMQTIFYWSDLFGTAVFAFSGVLMAGRLRMDGFGVIVLAAVTAIGGGTIRDLIIGADKVFWTVDSWYLWVILGTALIGQFMAKLPRRLPWYILPLADAFGLAIFTIIGAEKALEYGYSGMVAVVMGVITGVAGGMIRDVLAREIPMVLQREIYATASVLGGIIYTGSLALGMATLLATVLGMSGTLILRTAAIRWHLSLPIFALHR